MRRLSARQLAGLGLLLMGGIWILQGINVLPGSFMTGDLRWAVAGLVSAIAGFAVLMLARSRLPK